VTKPRYLPYTPPYDWGWMNSFLGARALAGVEQMVDGFYQRTLVVESETGPIAGWLRLRPLPERNCVELSLSPSLEPVAERVERQVSLLLDLDADPHLIAAGLGLLAMPGIGGWTASYVAMRAWSAPDVFLGGDYLIKQRFPNMTPGKIARYAQRWQPWRTYATLHLWANNDFIPEEEAQG